MKVRVKEDEFYPFYCFSYAFGDEIEIPKAKFEKFKRIFREFYEMQEELETLLEVKDYLKVKDTKCES